MGGRVGERAGAASTQSNKDHMSQADLLILGGGLVGSALAVALDRHGISSIVIDPADPAVILAAAHDGRASAIAAAPMRMLEAIGIADRLAGKGCPIQSIRVSDGLEPGKLDFDPQQGEAALGTMFENRHLRAALMAAASEAPLADVRMQTRALSVERDAHGVTATLSSGETVKAQLLIGAVIWARFAYFLIEGDGHGHVLCTGRGQRTKAPASSLPRRGSKASSALNLPPSRARFVR